MTGTDNTTWAHANTIIGGQLRRVVLGLTGPGKGFATSFPTTPDGEIAVGSKIRHFTATTWEETVAAAEAFA